MSIEPFRRAIPDLSKRMRECEIRQDAQLSHCIFSGGIYWSDEIPNDLSMSEIDLMRFLIHFRTKKVLGRFNSEFSELWEEMKEIAPDWPGFIEERMQPSPEILKQIKEMEHAIGDIITTDGEG